jgi:hypothetical protein
MIKPNYLLHYDNIIRDKSKTLVEAYPTLVTGDLAPFLQSLM